jgi:integrase
MPTLTTTGAQRATAVLAAAPATHLAPKRRRRAYGDKDVADSVAPLPVARAGRVLTINHTIQAMINAHTLDWATTQRNNCRGYLLSETGRFQQWLAAEGLETIDQLTTDKLEAFLVLMADRVEGPGLESSTVDKYRTHLRSLAHFQATTPGYGASLRDIDRIPKPRMPKERFAPALTPDQERRIVEACTTTRDRLIIEVYLATGVRISEMAALTLGNLFLAARPSRIHVEGSVHDPDCTKGRKPRTVTFRKSYSTLARRLLDWIATERDPYRLSPHQQLFLAASRGPGRREVLDPLGYWGYERLCDRISVRAGIHFSPHILRHTWATRLVDAGVQPLHLMEAGGWESIDMVRRYYSANNHEVLRVISTAAA